ncbi:hypothetical protein [Rugamonas sp.]|uniref:hypothetical protein n=1 Tax=Rugamonas sp. TaxID=1926287 RepID=UPI0025E93427|nr:hypothetical protein [Rugamonas sp.]
MGSAPDFVTQTVIYDKTDQGRDEIATRRQHLAPRLRTLLLLVDGRRSEQELLTSVAGLGLNSASLDELVAQHYIVATRLYATLPLDDAPPPAPTPAVAAAPTAPIDAEAPDPVQQFQALYQFYTRTIKSTVGLRGFTLQMKVERAATIVDLRELRQPFLDAVLKAKGDIVALELLAQLDRLL